MSELNEAALDSLAVIESDDSEGLTPVEENETEQSTSFEEDDLALESPEADSVEQKVGVPIGDDEYPDEFR
ncbi:hypothetical protein [Streptacidiphilus sp. MAP5-3]|uniref:hypothetical protein n=1 Tax=unclassified Streptacidiphilus TaxID=2643834 RepID=UPI0035127C32